MHFADDMNKIFVYRFNTYKIVKAVGGGTIHKSSWRRHNTQFVLQTLQGCD